MTVNNLTQVGLATPSSDSKVVLFRRREFPPERLQVHTTQRSATLHIMQAKRSALRVSHSAMPAHHAGMEPHEIRKRNVLALRRFLGMNYAQFALHVHTSERYLWQVRTEWKRPDGKPTNMGRSVARRIETHVGKRLPWMEPGWMEQPHWEDLPASIAEEGGDFLDRLRDSWAHYTEDQRKAFETLETSFRPPIKRRKGA